MSAPTRKDLARAALAYAARGWSVFPLAVSGTTPLSGSRGYKDATTDRGRIRAWWREAPYNVGIACGRVSNLVVIDVDGAEGEDSLRELEDRYGPLPETLRATSGRPHRHHRYHEYPDGIELRRAIKVLPGLDLLGDGGYVIAPPSVKTKGQRKRTYRWLNDREPAPFPGRLARIAGGKTREGSARPLPEIITEGRRNDLLTSLAGTMRRRGAPESAIRAALLETNDERCNPPLPDAEIEGIVRSAASWELLPLDLSEPINDTTMSARFARQEADHLRYCAEWRQWLAWDGRVWARTSVEEVQNRLKDTVLGWQSLAKQIESDDARETIESALAKYTQQRKLKDLEILARGDLLIEARDLDRDGVSVLNVMNGMLDLESVRVGRDGRVRAKLLPPDPRRLITKLAPVEFDPRADCPLWNGFLHVTLRTNPDIDWSNALADSEPDEELEQFVQELAGYSLTENVQEDALPFCYGPGGSGKTTFLGTVQRLLGTYAVTISFGLLLRKRFGDTNDDHRDLPRLHKARAAFASECPPGARWAQEMVKQLTGGDPLSGRWLYREKFDFEPTAKIWARANEKPGAFDPSDGIWRRMRLIPFDHRIADEHQDKNLRRALLEPGELSGILNWALAGLARWRERGRLLEMPGRSLEATEAYREEQVENDPIAPFLDERCRVRPGRARLWTPAAEIYEALERWWRDRGRPYRELPTPTGLGRALTARGLTPRTRRRRGRKVRGWRGIALRDGLSVE